MEICVGDLVCTTEYDYPEFHITMHCYMCSVINGEIELREHMAAKWLTKETLNSVNWLPADMEVLELLMEA